MGSGKLYALLANTEKKVKGRSFLRPLLFAGILLLSSPIISKAQDTAPVFVSPSTQLLVCENSAAIDLGSYLTINDPDTEQTETWTVVSNPSWGTLAGFPTAGSTGSAGGSVTPVGTSYTPNVGYSGPDQFSIMVDDGNGGTAVITITVVVNMPPSLTLGAVPAVCAGATSTTISFSNLQNVGPTTSFFSTVGNQVWNVPPGVTSMQFDVMGAVGGKDNHSGAANPGKGGRVQGNIPVTPGQLLNLYIGGSGGNGTVAGATGGYNGGGNAYFYFFGCGGAGGGATDIRIGGTALGNRVIVAGGGGGNGWDAPGPFAGGAGGGLNGGNSVPNISGSSALGGSQSGGGGHATYPGNPPGTSGVFGAGGNGSINGISGGGGGGWYGGGGGVWNGGGGGSSFTAPSVTGVTHTQGYNNGDGQILFSYTIPGTYTIQWDGAAVTAGFPAGGQSGILPSSPITVNIPVGVVAGVYNANLTISNPLCTSIQYPIQVTVNPIPDVTVPAGQVLCANAATSEIDFSGSFETTTFHWTNDNTGIGLADTGTGNIMSFTAANATAMPIMGDITVTPMLNGCSGTPATFTVTVNPLPTLSTPLTYTQCNLDTFSHLPMSGTPGTSFPWTRAAVLGLSNPSGSGTDNPDELLVNTTALPVTTQYIYVLSANSCVDTQTVNVTVYPSPLLSTSLTPPAICSGTTFSYPPASATPGTSFSWNRNAVPGVSNTSHVGTGNPLEVLNDTTADPVVVTYVYTMEAYTSCTWTQNVTVTVNPMPALNSAITPPALCDSQVSVYQATSATAGTTFAWYRNPVPGILNPNNSGIGALPGENLVNTTPNPVNVPYYFILSANSCQDTQMVMQTINPKPLLTNTLTPQVCDGIIFSYAPASLTAGTTFIWDRNAVAGISNVAMSGIGNPMETLNNTTTHAVIDTYAFTLMANGCSNTQYVRLTVNPTPKLSSTLFPSAICDSFTFSYPATSATAGTSFSWYRPYIPGIYAVAETGTGNVDQQLINSTYVPVPVTYIYSLQANGCVDTENVVLTVNPTPRLTGQFSETVCSGSPFHYTPVSLTPGATFAWNRPQVAGINPTTGFGTGSISEIVTNTGLTPITVGYIYRLGINGCLNLYTQTVTVVVNPTPPAPSITTSESSLCTGTLNQSFGISAPETPPVEYTWSAANATVMASGAGNQYAIISFMNTGNAVVTVSANVNGYTCYSYASTNVDVTNGAAPVVNVIYNNQQFIALRNDNSAYQWGYDDLHTLQSYTIPGAVNQNYYDPNPDFFTKHYWVMVTLNGCTQKAYYDDPPTTGVANVNANNTLKVYPNPTNNTVNVDIISSATGKVQVNVLDILGQVIATQTTMSNKATFDVSTLPAGCYMVECYRDDVKIANAKFVKN